MSLPAENKQRSLFDVPVLAAELFEDATNRYRIFREKVLPALWNRRGQLAALYCEDNGRPAIEPVIATAVRLLQFANESPGDGSGDRSVVPGVGHAPGAGREPARVVRA